MRRESRFRIEWDECLTLDKDDGSFGEAEFPRWSLFERAVFKLANSLQGSWRIMVDNTVLEFSYRPDLTTVFFSLPDMLEHITDKRRKEYSLYFFEQGTDLIFGASSAGGHVKLRLATSDQSRFIDLPDSPVFVRKEIFCEEWTKFIRKILTNVMKNKPDVSTDEHYIQYRLRIDECEMKIHSAKEGR